MPQHLVIIGNGIAGVTTARHVRKRDSKMKITIISAESDHFYSRPALMYIFMGHTRFQDTKPYEDWFWQKNRLDLVRAYVTKIDTDAKTLLLDDGRTISYDKLVIATGSQSNKFGWPGQNLPGVQGLYSLQDVELLEENSKNIERAVIVGGGLIGVELAEMLLSRNIPVTTLIREEWYWDNILPKDEAKLVCRHVLEHGIDLRRTTNLKEILPGNDGRVRAVLTESGEEIPCQLVGLTPGVHPNIDMAKNSSVETNRGVLVNDYLETNLPDVYAAGDCVEIKATQEGERNRFEQLWYTGKMHGEALAKTLTGERTKYERGIWYNSAKFFDIEYQTYGFVSNQPREGEQSLFWEHPDHRHCARIVYKQDSHEVTGFNFFGIRYRQEVCQRWIRDKRTIEYVLENLGEGNFDPEFFKQYESEIVAYYNLQHDANLRLKRRKGLFRKVFA
ncbi:MAG: NAD(P)/FAD-dependent oxidoreductase [bacterium]